MFTSSISVEGLQALMGGKDPVCGKELEANSATSTLNREGKTFFFCSKECREEFDAAPEKFCACY
jgi:YHS domain-containing protein